MEARRGPSFDFVLSTAHLARVASLLTARDWWERRLRSFAALAWVASSLATLPAAVFSPSIANAEAPTTSQHAADLADAGALAASMGEYAFAIQAFKQAHASSGSVDLLFAIAEAYRQRHALEGSPIDLEQSVASYRRYRDVAPTGEHAADAEHTLHSLEPELASLIVDDEARAKALREESSKTRLAVSCRLSNATVRIDGRAALGLPAFVVVAPGKHVLVVTAPGYSTMTSTIDLGAGAIDAESIVLDPKPAKLDVREPSGAEVYVDGISVGVAPLPAPVDIEPGLHTVTLASNGHASHTERLDLLRGKTRTLSVDLPTTNQRKAAFALVGTGGVTLSVGIAFGVLAVIKDRSASSIGGRFNQSLIGNEQQRYDDAIAARDRFRIGAGIAGGVGLGLTALGGFLFAFDSRPPPTAQKPRTTPTTKALLVVPIISPTFTGGSAAFRF
jgi:hypothetical protein